MGQTETDGNPFQKLIRWLFGPAVVQNPAPAQNPASAQISAEGQDPNRVQGIVPSRDPTPPQQPAAAQDPNRVRGIVPGRDPTSPQQPAAAPEPAQVQGTVPARDPVPTQSLAPAQSPPPATGGSASHLQRLIEQLYENEGLTDAMTDEPAKKLLSWAEEQLKGITKSSGHEADLDNAAEELQRLMRAINRLVSQQAELSETELVERLLKLVEQAMLFATQKSIANTEITSPDKGE